MDDQSSPDANLRIACLEPSATAICRQLGLEHYIVGITHECFWRPADVSGRPPPRVLTADGLAAIEHDKSDGGASAPMSQGAIHQAVQDSVKTCSRSNVPSLYPLKENELHAAQPTVIFTQDLCSVCAPTPKDVLASLSSQKGANAKHGDDSAQYPKMISLQPTTLEEVADTFVLIAEACGVPERGKRLRNDWANDFHRIQKAIESSRDSTRPKLPTLLILEWLDPPFDGGHWTAQMMEYAGVQNALGERKNPKSRAMQWEDVQNCDPDAVVVGCCGFYLGRNIEDVKRHADKLVTLRAAQSQRIFACNGNDYIAQPAPSLLQGTVVLAKCAYHDQPQVLQALDDLRILTEDKSMAYQNVDVVAAAAQMTAATNSESVDADSSTIIDMEDLMGGNGATKPGLPGFAKAHEDACQNGQKTYIDPETGYQVFTALAHQERGKCCGSGCRHCPYSHANVKADAKTTKIQQPSILYQNSGEYFSPRHHPNTKVLFFSGGKDSFLTIRALVRQYQTSSPFGLILLTTFDAATRSIAHQEVPINQVLRQANHLDITLLGIPLRRGSGETYLERIQRGLEVLGQSGLIKGIPNLVFGDLHLAHIKEWRDKTFSSYNLEYPLWNVEYSFLLQDLEASQVPCEISGSTVDLIEVGTPFTRHLYQHATQSGLDGFGETGEFHSLAKVWEVARQTALGL